MVKKSFIVGIFNGLLFCLLLGLVFSFGPGLKSEISYRLKKTVQPTSMPMPFPDLQAPDPYFSIVIPKIKAESKIIANIDAGNAKEYQPALMKGVAHAKGTVFPGMTGTIYLFAHSTDAPWNISRYNAVFYLLRELETGDMIVIFFNSKRYNYLVSEVKIVERTENDFFNQKEEELLVLQTCYPPGTTQKALLIFAKRTTP